jgi:hypothetical protein
MGILAWREVTAGGKIEIRKAERTQLVELQPCRHVHSSQPAACRLESVSRHLIYPVPPVLVVLAVPDIPAVLHACFKLPDYFSSKFWVRVRNTNCGTQQTSN